MGLVLFRREGRTPLRPEPRATPAAPAPESLFVLLLAFPCAEHSTGRPECPYIMQYSVVAGFAERKARDKNVRATSGLARQEGFDFAEGGHGAGADSGAAQGGAGVGEAAGFGGSLAFEKSIR